MRVIEQLPLADAARLAGVSPSTLSERSSKAEARVRAAFAEPEPHETEQETRP